MQLHEFAWKRTDDGPALDCRITVGSDGSYEIQNLQDPSQSVKFSSIEDFMAAFEQSLHRQK